MPVLPDFRQANSMTALQDIIIAWIAMGLNRKAIADRLHRSIKTVDWHLDVIDGKLGFHDMARLTHWAITHKLVKLNQTI